jgi:hypothetical protein
MPAEKIINSTTCWVKNKSNCANILFSQIIVDKKELVFTMKNRTFTQLNFFLTQQCSSIYILSSTVIATRAPGC